LRAAALATAPRDASQPALRRLRMDYELRELHLAQLAPLMLRPGGKVDAAMATARVKIAGCATLDDALAWLNVRETAALMSDPETLKCALALD